MTKKQIIYDETLTEEDEKKLHSFSNLDWVFFVLYFSNFSHLQNGSIYTTENGRVMNFNVEKLLK